MSVNLSPRQLTDPTLADAIARVLVGERATADCLQLEITESELADRERSLKTLRALSDLGIRLAIDDFGSSESTLARLHELPIDTLKIDKAFLRGWSTSSDQVDRLLTAVVAIAEALDMETVAEGVETEEQARAIRAAGCTFGQGYLWARPLTAADAFDFAAASWQVAVPTQAPAHGDALLPG
jgi:EAL domain-containing protein (putative c-di-GMP-specific phosphodiesterase class I)